MSDNNKAMQALARELKDNEIIDSLPRILEIANDRLEFGASGHYWKRTECSNYLWEYRYAIINRVPLDQKPAVSLFFETLDNIFDSAMGH